MPDKHFTLKQLNQSVRRLIESIRKDFWITAEVANVSLGRHAYFELVQKDEDAIVAKARAQCWSGQLEALHDKLGDDLEELLRPGCKLLMRVLVTFHEVHGLSLNVQDIDPSYTIGELERKRLATISRLEEEGLTDRQRALELPAVLQRLAVISSADAAGLGDFVDQLEGNAYGYRFEATLFPAAVQGQWAVSEIGKRLGEIGLLAERFDAIVLIRGGGSKLDLQAFDEYDLAERIAKAPLPVLTGIGHQRDTSVADLCAFRAFKTPTAVAEFAIDRMAEFESAMQLGLEEALSAASRTLLVEKERVRQLSVSLQREATGQMRERHVRLSTLQSELSTLTRHTLARSFDQLESLAREVRALDPQRVLARGFTLTTVNGKPLAGQSVEAGDELTTRSANQVLISEVIRTVKNVD